MQRRRRENGGEGGRSRASGKGERTRCGIQDRARAPGSCVGAAAPPTLQPPWGGGQPPGLTSEMVLSRATSAEHKQIGGGHVCGTISTWASCARAVRDRNEYKSGRLVKPHARHAIPDREMLSWAGQMSTGQSGGGADGYGVDSGSIQGQSGINSGTLRGRLGVDSVQSRG